MEQEKTRVLIVDDSPTMRKLIRAGLEADARLEVVAEAGSAVEARNCVKTVEIDAITLDIEMPGMNGLEFLERLMAARPKPVIMISAHTAEGSEAAVRALALGAADCIEKPRFGEAQKTFARLAELLVAVSPDGRNRTRGIRRQTTDGTPGQVLDWNGKSVLIGASTGGVEALEYIFSGFPRDCPPTFVTQHMPAQFLASFAQRLNAIVAPDVRLAVQDDVPRQGQILFAPGGDVHLEFHGETMSVDLRDGPKCSGHRPSVDRMFLSAIPYGARVNAAVLTGMGRDGAAGMLELNKAGAHCIGQDEHTCVVFGMPRAAHELGALHELVALPEISRRLLQTATRKPSAARVEHGI